MQVKVTVIKEVKEKLEREQAGLRGKCASSKRQIKQLVEKQTIMKREIALLGKLINKLPR